MSGFVQLPRLPIPATEDAEALRKKWAERKAELDRERFWAGVQDSKQPVVLIEEHEDTFVSPVAYDDYHGPIG